jgi:solute carrier family 25 protein 34/35
MSDSSVIGPSRAPPPDSRTSTTEGSTSHSRSGHHSAQHLRRAWSTRVLEYQFVLPRTPPVQVPLWQTLAFAAIAPSLASVITNPFEVAKVRLQLQHSNAPKGIFRQVPETLNCLRLTWQLEGIRGLQRGLSLVLWQNSARNVVRLGLYEKVMGILHPQSKNIKSLRGSKKASSKANSASPPLWKRVIGGAICGMLGAVSGNPFDIIKTRWQAQGRAVESQTVHQYRGTWHAFQTVLQQEGIRGLYVGVLNNMVRQTYCQTSRKV